ncbi:hypothetical protein [Spongiactinospora sp. TRM90649]|uniref:hypothetical protein n=1 Tax=Spongiactinospora sp. TRM90649 TaxID=3031114 RepID=UPI0023F8240A|nr:hypothetical protein [Spongiactinospora sp. TRM90649]MDF5751251.1 hypothetical protein [Spongiactinospora sp. TRM90649]
MKTLRNMTLGVASAAALLMGGPAVAHAEPAPAAAPTGTPAPESAPAPSPGPKKQVTKQTLTGKKSSAQALYPDGYLYVYSDDMGYSKKYAGNAYEGWPSGWNNAVDVLWNNGYPGGADDVNIYDYSTGVGAYACIGNGDYWDLRADPYVFSWYNDYHDEWARAPLGKRVHDRGSGHIWVSWCGNNNR